MRFDDRLMTVLSQPASDRHDSAVRWRQLVDLVARAGSSASNPAVGQALESIRTDAANVDEELRAAAARAIAALPVPLGLLEYFASDKLAVSAPVLAAASLDKDEWRRLLAVADEETRRFIATLHPELSPEPAIERQPTAAEPPAMPLGPSAEEPAPQAPLELQAEPATPAAETQLEPVPPPAPAGTSLHDVVARIERRRRSRSQARRIDGSAATHAGPPALFRWECGPGGEIAWVDGAPRGALIGRSIARQQDSDSGGVDPDVVRAFMLRAPFRDAGLKVGGDGLVSGDWKISGVPAFEPVDGRFAGYRGVALREQPATAAANEPAAAEFLSDPDSLRELVHEIKTPLNAIIGFAEIIDGQFLGPADRRYRERARDIVGQARLLVTATDDLDFAAKVHSATGAQQQRVQIGELVERLAPPLGELAVERGATLETSRPSREAAAAVEPELADRLIFRMCSAVLEQAAAGERLRLWVDQSTRHIRVAISRPAALAALDEVQLLGGGAAEQGFSLRLARGLARIAGGDVALRADSLALVLPRG